MRKINPKKSTSKDREELFSSLLPSKMVSYFVFVCLAANIFTEVSSQTEAPEVTLPQGKIIGTFETYKNVHNDPVTYSAFRGIPYAMPPVGPRRFKNPEKHDGWSSAHDASKFGAACPQWDSQGRTSSGEENCLFLNIYTPFTGADGTTASAKYPVMVFIHGGLFQQGSSIPYEQYRLISKDIILVTFNYRLGILGFLSTRDEVCPGNLGLKDQVLALQWIQENILKFGGDSSSVTLFGQGAGAVSAFLHILSPMSQGLFHQAITQSGSPFCDWTLEEDPKSYALEVAKTLGCSTKSSTAMIDCIRGKSIEDVLQAQKKNKTFGNYPLRSIPVVEEKGFLPDTPAKLLESGNLKPIPLISGVNKDDGAFLYPLIRSYQDSLKKNSTFLLDELIPLFLKTATDIRDNIEFVSQAVYFQYFNGIDPTNVTQVLQPFVNVSTDAMFVSCNYRTLQSYSDKGARVYMYTFEYKGEYSMLERSDKNTFKYDGVSHGDELLYLFDLEGVNLVLPKDTNKKEQMNHLWATFTKTGSPPLTASGEYPKWEPYNSENKYYYKIDNPNSRHSSYKQREIDFWLNHLPALSRIRSQSQNYEIAGFGWSMFALAIILLILLIAVTVVLVKKTRGQYVTTKTEDK